MGEASRCAGTLEVKAEDWRPVDVYGWSKKDTEAFCGYVGCGVMVSVKARTETKDIPVWRVRSNCFQSGSALRECVTPESYFQVMDLTCSSKLISDIILNRNFPNVLIFHLTGLLSCLYVWVLGDLTRWILSLCFQAVTILLRFWSGPKHFFIHRSLFD